MVPETIAKKYPSAPLDWRWQFVLEDGYDIRTVLDRGVLGVRSPFDRL